MAHGNGEGTVRRRKDGRWEARITTGHDLDGRPIRWSFYGRTRADVVKDMQDALKDVRAGTYVPPSTATLGEWLDVWLREYVRPSVRKTTYAQYESLTRLHVKPALAGHKVRDLQAADIQRLLNDELATGLSARTVRLLHTVLHASLKQAALEGIVIRNVADYVRKPRGPQRQMRVLTQDEMTRLLDVAAGDRIGPALITLLGTGLRVGELIALQWSDVDLQEGILRVSRSASRVSRGDGHTEIVIDEPKTLSGRRTIPLPAPVLEAVKEWRRRQAEERLQSGEHWHDTGLVFTGYLGVMLDRSNIRRSLDRLCRQAGIPHVGIHALRHTFATRMLEAGVPARIVQEMLGHSRVAVTLDIYTHVLPDQKRKAADILAGVLSSPDSGWGQIGVKRSKRPSDGVK